MSKQVKVFFGMLLVAVAIVGFSRISELRAQSSFSLAPGGLLSACLPPGTKQLVQCNVAGDPANPDGLYLSANGAPYFRVQASGGGNIVSSFNGRTGNVLPVSGDYTWPQIGAKPTNIVCNGFTFATTGVILKDCTLN